MESGNRDHARLNLAARFAWVCEDPIEIEHWNIGLQLRESRTVADVPDSLRPRLPLSLRASLWFLGRFFPKQMRMYQLCVLAGQ